MRTHSPYAQMRERVGGLLLLFSETKLKSKEQNKRQNENKHKNSLNKLKGQNIKIK